MFCLGNLEIDLEYNLKMVATVNPPDHGVCVRPTQTFDAYAWAGIFGGVEAKI